MLNSRQAAGLLWLVVFIVWVVYKNPAGLRSSVRSMLGNLFSRQMLSLFTLIIGYNAVVVWWLWRIGYWDATMLYDTAIFIAVGGIGSVFKASPQGTTFDRRFFLKTILVNLEVMVVIAFLSDLFPFHFLVEFFLFIPFMTVLIVMVLFSEKREGAEQVHRLLSGVQSFVGFALLGYLVWKVATEFPELADLQVLYQLLLPLVMSLFFVPLLFLICVDLAYQDANLIIVFKQQDKRLARWKKWRLFLRFGLRLKGLQTFRRSRLIHEYAWVKSKEEAKGILKSWTGVVPEDPDGEEDAD